MSIKRIAILSVHTSPLAALGEKKTGGMNVYLREVSRQFSQRGIHVDIYTRCTSEDLPAVDYSLAENVRVIYLNAGPPQALDPGEVYAHLQQFAARVIAFNTMEGGTIYDLIFSHYWLSGWVAYKLNEVWGTPIVHMFHTLGHMKNRIASKVPTLFDERVTTETQIVEWADRIVAATEAEQSQLLWLYRADRRKIVIVSPGVDADRFKPVSQKAAREQLAIDDDCNLLLFVGRIEPLKAIDTIIQAIDTIRADKPHLLDQLCFSVIGGDPDNPADTEIQRLQALVKDLDLDRVVRFLGAKDHSLLPLYYSAASAVIIPSDYESFGMVALEAMSSGTPVIATEVGGLAFLVRDQSTGFLVPSRDPAAIAESIIMLLTQPEKQKSLGQNAAALAEQYSWSKITDRLLEVFGDVLKSQSNLRMR
jgi:D-inositol-3-phosphate glycosyltransferase